MALVLLPRHLLKKSGIFIAELSFSQYSDIKYYPGIGRILTFQNIIFLFKYVALFTENYEMADIKAIGIPQRNNCESFLKI